MKTPGSCVTLGGKPVTLIGRQVDVNQQAPDFVAVAQDLSTVEFVAFRGKPCILSSVVSLDTQVCDAETRRFNEEAVQLSPDVEILVISMDLPFAQKRWCSAAGVERVTTLSDHRHASFGAAYGVLIDDLRLLARAVFVVDRNHRITYKAIVREITREPDYDVLLAAVRHLD